jgi:predicted metal-dependent enzyme (double-stranded beta helix superfamily)
MFQIDRFIADCVLGARGCDPAGFVEEVLARAVSSPGAVAAALPLERAEIVPLYTSPELSVLKVVWAPGMSFRPHNHLMWAAIGLYAGQEDNTFYRRERGRVVACGREELRTGAVAVLSADIIHEVANPTDRLTGAIHVYGGDIANRPGRSEWARPSLTEVAYDFERARRTFEAANGELREQAG